MSGLFLYDYFFHAYTLSNLCLAEHFYHCMIIIIIIIIVIFIIIILLS